jgi:carbonic anhydrase
LPQSRSDFLTGAAALLFAAPATLQLPTLESTADPAKCPNLSPVDANGRLVAGNDRFVSGHLKNPNRSPGRRNQVAPRQCPFAVVLACADSRLAPEILFDQGLGDLFVCRVAGNVADVSVTGSIEYAVAHFHSPLVVVLGHERCGAVGAALDALRTGVLPPDGLGGLVNQILPNIRSVPAGADQWGQAVSANASAVAAGLSLSPALRPRISKGKLRIVAATYGLVSGRVTFAAG